MSALASLALCLASTQAPAADETDREPAAALTPLRMGQSEVSVGLGGGFAGNQGVFEPLPAGLLAARIGLTDNLEIALPLVATVSLHLPLPLSPQLAFGGGLASVGFTRVVGAYVVPSANLSIHLQQRTSAMFAEIGVVSGPLGSLFMDPSPTAFAAAGWQFAVAPRVTLGLAAEASIVAVDLLHEGRELAHVTIGSSTIGPHSQTPLVRVTALETLYLDLWTSVDVARSQRPPSAEDNIVSVVVIAGVTWTPQLY